MRPLSEPFGFIVKRPAPPPDTPRVGEPIVFHDLDGQRVTLPVVRIWYRTTPETWRVSYADAGLPCADGSPLERGCIVRRDPITRELLAQPRGTT